MDRRKSAGWMMQLDERIPEYLQGNRWATPKIMFGKRPFTASEGRIQDRYRMLHYAGLVAPIHGEMYELTLDGMMYLEGEIDAKHCPWPTVDRALQGWNFRLFKGKNLTIESSSRTEQFFL